MIILITTPGRHGTVRCLRDGTFGVEVPDLRTTDYARLLRAWMVPRATYIFTDFERLYPRELKAASDLYRRLREAGLRCLNDPALAMSRAELLTVLERRGINPFGVHRADTQPAPRRFPVFIREEMGHVRASPDLYYDQASLERALFDIQRTGIPLRGQLVIELAAEPYIDGLFAKWGTWRIGDHMIVEHVSVDDTWLVKTGDKEKRTDAISADEDDAVFTNRFAAELAPAFDLAHIEYGRADHGRFRGRPVIYEINTNPYINPFLPAEANPRRIESRLFSRRRIAESLEAIDTPQGGRLRLRDWSHIFSWRKAKPSLRP